MAGQKDKYAKTFVCTWCSKVFSFPSLLKIHERSHTEEKPYQCSYCELSFARSHDLKIHVRKHTGERPFPCDLCDMTFARSNHLKRHMLVHTGEKPEQCEECKKHFRSLSHLKMHMLTHTGQKKYSCNVCDKAFGYKHALKRHLFTHTGKRPFLKAERAKFYEKNPHLAEQDAELVIKSGYLFQCFKCTKTFPTIGRLMMHMPFHSGPLPYKCCACNVEFQHWIGLKVHMYLHYDDQVVDVSNPADDNGNDDEEEEEEYENSGSKIVEENEDYCLNSQDVDENAEKVYVLEVSTQ